MKVPKVFHYVATYVHAYKYCDTHAHTCMHTCTPAYTHAYMPTMYTQTNTHIRYTHTCAHTPYTHIHTNARTHIHQHILITLSFSMCSKAYHSLVQLLMEKEASRDMASKEQAWHIFVEALECISQCNNVNNYIHTYIHFVNIEMCIV